MGRAWRAPLAFLGVVEVRVLVLLVAAGQLVTGEMSVSSRQTDIRHTRYDKDIPEALERPVDRTRRLCTRNNRPCRVKVLFGDWRWCPVCCRGLLGCNGLLLVGRVLLEEVAHLELPKGHGDTVDAYFDTRPQSLCLKVVLGAQFPCTFGHCCCHCC